MIMEARAKRLSTPLQWGRREKIAVGSLLAVVVAALIALGAYALTSGSPGRTDCVEAFAPSTLGAVRIHGCGGQARQLCATATRQRGIADTLSASCRRAGFPVD
ncbi:MAG TPA: hypothetical protein VN672_08950 [Solirubrobacteraceae bacterium]|nr:hypothetical protein [Solirubrobacteraceae bacterium]